MIFYIALSYEIFRVKILPPIMFESILKLFFFGTFFKTLFKTFFFEWSIKKKHHVKRV